MTIHAYFAVSPHTLNLDSASWSDSHSNCLAPDASRRIPYGDTSRITSCSEFITFTAFNTLNSRSTPDLVSIALGLSPDLHTSNGTFGIQRLDPAVVVRYLKDNKERQISSMLNTRAVHHFSPPVGLGGSELLVVGTCAQHLMWVTSSDRVELMTLLGSEMPFSTESMSASSRNLVVPVDPKDVR